MSKSNRIRAKKFEQECVNALLDGFVVREAKSKGKLIGQAMDDLIDQARKEDPMALQLLSVCREMFLQGHNYIPIVLAYSLEYCNPYLETNIP